MVSGVYQSIANGHHDSYLRKLHNLSDEDELKLMVPKQAKEIAERITSPHNQDFRMIVVGAFGKGKSMYALYMGYRVAEEVAKIKGGAWQDYFSTSNIGIVTEENILGIIKTIKKYNVYILDDVGRSWGARNFMDRLNKFLNDIFQLMRTDNTFIIITIASTFLVDKVPRNLVNALAELDLSYFDYGLVLPKFFEVSHRPRYGKTFYIYPVFGTSQVVRYKSKIPPLELIEPYLQKREEIARELRQNKVDEILNPDEKNQPKRTKQEVEYPTTWKLIHEKGWTQKAACEFMGIASNHYRDWEKKFKVE